MSDTEVTPAQGEAAPAVDDEDRSTGRATRKSRTGLVVSDAMDKTIVVEVERFRTHDLYGKTLQRSNKLYAHDEHDDANAGDRVRIVETRPLSKKKRWRLAEIIERAK